MVLYIIIGMYVCYKIEVFVVNMKANIPKELEELIDEKIYIDLEIHILNTRLNKSNENKDKDRIIYFENRLDQKFKERKKVNDQLRKEHVKIFSPVSDDMFVQYDFSIKIKWWI